MHAEKLWYLYVINGLRRFFWTTQKLEFLEFRLLAHSYFQLPFFSLSKMVVYKKEDKTWRTNTFGLIEFEEFYNWQISRFLLKFSRKRKRHKEVSQYNFPCTTLLAYWFSCYFKITKSLGAPISTSPFSRSTEISKRVPLSGPPFTRKRNGNEATGNGSRRIRSF